MGPGILPVQFDVEDGLGLLVPAGHDLLRDDQGGAVAHHRPGIPPGGVDPLDLDAVHLHGAARGQFNDGCGVQDILSLSPALAVMLFHIADPGVLSDEEAVDAVMLAVLIAGIMDGTAGHDGDVRPLPDVEVVVDQIRQSRPSDDHRDMDALILRPRLDPDIDAGLVGLGHVVDVGGGLPFNPLPVGPDIEGAHGHLVESRYLF